jgi:hypothetical protein
MRILFALSFAATASAALAQPPAPPAWPKPDRTWRSPGNTTYYVDSAKGDDARDGRSPGNAWKSLDRVNAGTFAPGDRILLRAGSSWEGFLAPGGSGSAKAPIVIGRYGRGPKPAIDAAGKHLATLFIHNGEYWGIRNLDIANRDPKRTPAVCGVKVEIQDFGTAHGIRLSRLYVHDVNGCLEKDRGGGNGISVVAMGDRVKTRYDGLIIEDCRLERTDRNGIVTYADSDRAKWYPSLNVVIRRNTLIDIGGDGIVPIACDGALIERNVLRGGRMRCEDYAAGIWPWGCDNTVIQYNEVSRMRGTKDGQGFDSDWNCRNTLFQYNYSHDNDGGFMLICNNGESNMPYSIGNVGTVIRYNISQNDGARTFHISGPVKDTAIYNNVIYVKKGLEVKGVLAGNWGGGWPDDTRFTNNIFLVDGGMTFDFGGMTKTVFEHNVFFGGIQGIPAGTGNITTDPMLVAPGTGRDGLDTLKGYHLKNGSSCIGAGKAVAGDDVEDFWGRTVKAGVAPSVGVRETGRLPRIIHEGG